VSCEGSCDKALALFRGTRSCEGSSGMPVSAGGHSAPVRGSVDANAYMVHEITINCRSIGPFCVVVNPQT